VLGLKCCDRPATVAKLETLYRQSKPDTDERCRLGIALLELGAPRAAREELALRTNPSARVRFIHLLPGWHGDLGGVLESLRSVADPAFQSGLCLALGTIDPARLPSDRQRTLEAILAQLYTTAPDGATHSAAGWALTRRGVSLPAIPRTRGPVQGHRWFVNGQGMTFIGIEPGVFQPKDYQQPASSQGPFQTIVLTRPFFMLDQGVTAEWYRRFLKSNDHPRGEELTELARHEDLGHGIASVHWRSAVLFCNWLSRVEGRTPCYRLDPSGRADLIWDVTANGYRLPTDAEREYVYRSGTTTQFVTGDDVSRMLDYGRILATGFGPGKQYYPNPWGLFDLLGNWWEACWDDGYPEDVHALFLNPVGAAGARHSMRGGSYDAGTLHFPASYRAVVAEDHPLGFRPVCGPLERGDEGDEKTAALRVLTRHLEQYPESRPRLGNERARLAAELAQQEKDTAEYSQSLERELAHNPKNADAWFNRGWLHACRGRWREALADHSRAAELAPHDGAIWLSRSVAHAQLGDLDRAALAYTEAVAGARVIRLHSRAQWSDQDHKAPSAHLGHWQVVANHLDRVFGAGEPAWWVWRGRGLAAAALGRWSPALAHFDRAAALKPDDPDVWHGTARSLAEVGQWRAAGTACATAAKLRATDGDMWYLWGIAERVARNHDRAAACYTKALALHFDGWAVWTFRGLARAEQGRWQEACDDLTRAAGLPGVPVWAIHYLALLRFQLGDQAGYRNACAQMLRRLAKEPEFDSAVWVASGATLAADSGADLTPLVRVLELEAARQPDNCNTHHRLGPVYCRTGRFADAVRELDRAVAIHARSKLDGLTQDYLFLALAHARLGQTEQARQYLGKASAQMVVQTVKGLGTSAAPWHTRLENALLKREVEELLRPAVGPLHTP
jgi:tetratricopeptide (TPR) repeat protein